ncbi:ATP-binding protein [Anaerolineales bacterium HSG24]|nr:ATP-binding protein [Anaerolineales bacterium HSG24]
MTKILAKLKIHQKLQLGFGVMVFLTLIVVGLNYLSGIQATADIKRSANFLMPTALTSANARTTLLMMLADIRGYLVLGEPEFRQRYEENKEQFVKQLTQMKQLSTQSATSNNQQQLVELEQKFIVWSALPEQMFQLHDDPILNQPAFRIMAEEGEGPLTVIFPQLNELIKLQAKREATPKNLQLLRDMADFQGSFSSIVSNVRAYLITLNSSQKFQYQASLAANQSAWERLVSQRDILTSKQQNILNNIAQSRNLFLPLPKRMFAAIEGDHAREDLFLLSTQAEPLAEDMLNLLDGLVVSQQTLLQTNLSNGAELLATTRVGVLFGGVVALVLGGGMAYLFNRQIAGPLKQLTLATTEIATGNLNVALEVEREDEIGSLMKAFKVMINNLSAQNAIADTISQSLDLETILAVALEHTLKVIGVEAGAIYLVDANKELMSLEVHTGLSPHFVTSMQNIRVGEGVSGQAVSLKRPVLSDNINYPTERSVMIDEQLQIMISVPLIANSEAVGVLTVGTGQLRQFTEQELALLVSIGQQVGVGAENARLFAETTKAKEKADLANQAKSEFLSSMSHELRTPLNGILGYAQILKRNDTITTFQRNGLDIIQSSGDHLLTLITDILDLSKIEAGKMELQPASIYLPNFLAGVAGMIRMRAEQKKLLFSYEPAPDLPSGIEVDEKRLRQILLNLLGNAIKFTDKGQVSFRILDLGFQLSDLETDETDKIDNRNAEIKTLKFEISDTGIGIPPEQLETIFQPFEQVGDRRKQAQGTGLGLAISRQLVQAMGSELQVESVADQGSKFWFELTVPVIKGLSQLEDKKPKRTITGYQGTRRKVLVVDDKEYNISVLTNMIEPLGFEISTARNGQEAISQTQTIRPDIIFMDMIMPVMTGFEATQEIRKLPELQGITIVGASASAFEEDKKRVTLVGCDAFLAKPISEQELLEVLEELLDLQWNYLEQTETSPDSADQIKDDTEPELLLPPQEVLTQLYNLADVGNMRKIRRQTSQLEEQYQPFAQQVEAFAKGFQKKQLLAFLEQYV